MFDLPHSIPARAASAADKRRRLYEALRDRAAKGEPALSNHEIADLCDLASPSCGNRLLGDLVKLEMITVVRTGRYRVVTITATGDSTDRTDTHFLHNTRREADKLDESEILRRRDAAIAERRAKEAHWLDLEQTRYRLPQRGRALSEMVV